MARKVNPLTAVGTGAALAVAGYGLAASPLLAAGVAAGMVVVGIALAWPLVIVGTMLALGPLNLSGLSGGQRALLAGLGGLDMNGIRLLGVAAGLGTVVLTRRDLLAGLFDREVRWYTVFLIWGAASLAFSPMPLEGLRLLLKLAYPLLIYHVVAAQERSVGETRRLADWALWGAVVLLLVNPLFVVNGGVIVEPEAARASGAGTHMNPFSFYLLAIILLCVARLGARGQIRYLWLAGLAAVWMALTLTRITMLATLVAICVMAAYVAIVNRKPRILGALAVLGALIAGLTLEGILLRTFGYVPSIGQMLALALDPVGLYEAINWQGRETLWEILAIAFRSSPWIGSGLGASTYAIAVAFGPEAPHNEYLRLAVDVGLIGCALYLMAVLAWIAAVVRAVRSAGSSGEEFTMPALALIAAWAVIAITDNAFDYYTPFTQYVGFLVAASVVAGRTTSSVVESAAAQAPVVRPPALAGAP
jgi:O-antigen ligase